jgi:WD40 repeat protein
LGATLVGATQAITCIHFSPNEELIVGSSSDNNLRVWGIQHGRERVKNNKERKKTHKFTHLFCFFFTTARVDWTHWESPCSWVQWNPESGILVCCGDFENDVSTIWIGLWFIWQDFENLGFGKGILHQNNHVFQLLQQFVMQSNWWSRLLRPFWQIHQVLWYQDWWMHSWRNNSSRPGHICAILIW